MRVHIVKREDCPLLKKILLIVGAVALALVLGGLVLLAMGVNPLEYYFKMFTMGMVGNKIAYKTFENYLKVFVPLALTSVALSLAFKMRFWNIGAEGQVLIGCLATAACMICLADKLPNAVLILVSLAAALAAGALWGFLPAFFKAKWNTNETLFTLMMNYVAIQITSYCVAMWENPVGSNTVGVINQMTGYGWFPAVLGQSYGLNVILVLVLTVGMYIYLKHSKQGYEIAVVGDSENTARYAGINVRKVTIRTMAISGAICGLAGFIEVAGVSHTISTATAGGRGFTAIIVAWLAKFNTFVMILISFLLVFLQKGAVQIASQFNLNDYASNIITGIILFFILGSEFFINYRVILRGRKEADAK